MPKPFSVIPGGLSLDDWQLSEHAEQRLRHRQFTACEVAFVLQYGHIEYRTGVRFFFLGAKQIPVEQRDNIWVQRLIGSVVLVNSLEPTIVTMYRHKDALRVIRKKRKARAAGW